MEAGLGYDKNPLYYQVDILFGENPRTIINGPSFLVEYFMPHYINRVGPHLSNIEIYAAAEHRRFGVCYKPFGTDQIPKSNTHQVTGPVRRGTVKGH
jgi:hypothetical protein